MSMRCIYQPQTWVREWPVSLYHKAEFFCCSPSPSSLFTECLQLIRTLQYTTQRARRCRTEINMAIIPDFAIAMGAMPATAFITSWHPRCGKLSTGFQAFSTCSSIWAVSRFIKQIASHWPICFVLYQRRLDTHNFVNGFDRRTSAWMSPRFRELVCYWKKHALLQVYWRYSVYSLSVNVSWLIGTFKIHGDRLCASSTQLCPQ